MHISNFLAARIAFAALLASVVHIPAFKRCQYQHVLEHPRRMRVLGPVNPAGTKIARLAAARAVGLRGRF